MSLIWTPEATAATGTGRSKQRSREQSSSDPARKQIQLRVHEAERQFWQHQDESVSQKHVQLTIKTQRIVLHRDIFSVYGSACYTVASNPSACFLFE